MAGEAIPVLETGKDRGATRRTLLASALGLLLGLQFFDRLEVTQRPAPGQVMFTLHLQTSQPLRK